MKAQMHSKILAIAAAVLIGMATTSGAALARGVGSLGGFGSAHMGGGFHGGPYMGGQISTPPSFNPSSGYTVPTSPGGAGFAGKSWISIPLMGDHHETSNGSGVLRKYRDVSAGTRNRHPRAY
jgi:hypothetical protein